MRGSPTGTSFGRPILPLPGLPARGGGASKKPVSDHTLPLNRLRGIIVSLALLALFAAACASSSGSPPTRGFSRMAATNELRFGVSGQQPPLNMTARNGELIGMEIAMARVLAQSIGVEAIFVRLPFGSLLDALDRGEIDVAMSGITITPKRSQRVTFVGPYFTSGKTLLTKSKQLAEVKTAEGLDSPDLKLVALAGSTSEDFVRSSAPQAQLALTDGLDEAIQIVVRGEADALVADRETCQFAVLRNPDAGLIASTTMFTVEPMGIAVPLDEPQLANLMQTYLTALQSTGALDRVRAFWFENPSWVKDLR